MTDSRRAPLLNPDDDPFRETGGTVGHERRHVLGGRFEFTSNSRRLLRLVDEAYAGLPGHRLATPSPRFRVRLQLAAGPSLPANTEPPGMRMQGGAGLLCGVMDAANYAVLSPMEGRGLVVVSRALLDRPYYARYELLEFAVFVLAGRAQGLVSLHAACVGLKGRGLLLIGESGSGKSTVALQCLLRRFDFLTEDAAFVLPDGMLATGVPNFLHVRPDSLRFLQRGVAAPLARRSLMIRRRSGVEKLEVDLRRTGWRLASRPLEVAGVVFISARPGKSGRLLSPMPRTELLARLDRSQRYAAIQPGWVSFRRQLAGMNAYELRRGGHPAEAAEAIRTVLDGG